MKHPGSKKRDRTHSKVKGTPETKSPSAKRPTSERPPAPRVKPKRREH